MSTHSTLRRISSLFHLPLLAFAVATATDLRAQENGFAVGPGHTALWFKQARNGEGWVLEILGPDLALGYWFTYDEDGNQRWLIGTGEIDGDTIHFAELQVTSGGRFGPDFDPDEVVREFAGTATMIFTGCDEGGFEFDAFEQMLAIDHVRLTRTMLVDCNPPADALIAPRAHQSGTWFDPDHDGEGFILQWLVTGQAVMTWFSYDIHGNQFWMQGIGEEVDGMIVFPNVIATAGPRFGTAYDADDLELIEWGVLTMELDCATGVAEYASVLPEFGSGSFTLRRLTIPDALGCPLPEPDPGPPDLGDAAWSLRASSGPALSELPAAVVGDFIYVAGGVSNTNITTSRFWRYAPATNTWTRLQDMPGARDHGMMAAHDGLIYFFGGDTWTVQAGQVNAWRYDPATGNWAILPDMPGGRNAGAAVALGDHIYVTGGTRNTIDRYTPATNTWVALPSGDPSGGARDHSTAVAFEGEIWILGGRTIGAHTVVTIFDPATGTSRPGPPMNVQRSGFAAAVAAGHIIVAGGENFSPPQLIISAEAYSPASGEWQMIERLPVAVHGVSAAGFGGNVYVMLGSTELGGFNSPGHVQVLEIPEP